MNQHFASLILGLAGQANAAMDGQLPPGAADAGANDARQFAKALIDTLGAAAITKKTLYCIGKKYHPEGDALYHSLQVFDLACDERAAEGRLRTRGDLHEAIIHGAVKRVRPKAMTVFAAMLGLLPIM